LNLTAADNLSGVSSMEFRVADAPNLG